MDWLMQAVERDLGIDRRQQGPGPRPRELVALVPVRFVTGLRERRLIRCSRFDSISEADICTYLQSSQAKLPAGWTRVCIQGLRKSKLSYRLGRDVCHQQMEFLSQDSYVRTMQCVSLHNVRNLWRETHYKLVQTYAGANEQMHVAAVDAVRHALQKLFNTTFMSSDRASPSLSPAREKEKDNCLLSSSSCYSKLQSDQLCPNVLPAECLLETAEMLYVILPYTQYSLHDIVSFSPAKLANSHAKVLFILYQLLTALQACHSAGLSCGELSLLDIAVDEQLCSRLKLNLAHYEELGMEGNGDSSRREPKNVLPSDNTSVSHENKRLCKDCFVELKTLVLDWIHGRVSNFRYLMELNRLAGRREGDPNYHPVLPWVVDFTVPFGKFRDLRRSKFRLNKGDKQLDFTYEMTKEALAAAVGNGVGGGGVGGDLSGCVGAGSSGPSDHLHVPHHISDVLSDITYYVYKARQTPKSVLCSHVRSQWEPNEYPASMERMQSWTPDECIPEFYTDPSIFRSIHPDMPDLDVPSWCKSCEEFIEVHRRLLESREVSQHLHHWIDLTFGYKLSGKEAVRAKNVCLHLVDNHTNLTTYGVVQLFDQPHPPRLSPTQYAPAEPPLLGLAALNVPSLQLPPIDTVADTVDGMVPESTGCETSGWTMVDKDEELEQGTEALDSLATTGSSTSASCAVPLSSAVGGKMGGEHTGLIVSQSPSSFPGDFTGGMGPSLRSAVLQRSGPTNKKHGEANVTASNVEDIKIILPECFNPLQPLEELEKLNNFLVKSLHAEVWHPAMSNDCTKVCPMIETLPSLTQLYQRDMQAFGVLIAEIFHSAKLRGIKPGTPLRQRFQAVMKLCSASLRDVPLSLHHALETLLLIEKHSEVTQREHPDCPSPLLFKYDPICDGLPPPNPQQLLNSVISPFPFPSYFAALHYFIFSYHARMGTMCSVQGRDVVFNLWQQLEVLLRSNITAEGLEILLPFILALMLEESTAVYAAWYLFEPISKVLGPRNASKYLLKPLINVYENPHCLRGRFYLYTDCFILQLIVRLGLQAFLANLLPHVLQVITGFESSLTDSGGEAFKGMRTGMCNLGEEEEEDFQCGEGRTPSGSVSGGGSGASGGVGVGGDSGLMNYSSGITLNDQVFLSEAEDFQNGFYVNSGAGVAAGKPLTQNSAAKEQDQESLSVGKLSDKSSTSELSLGDDSMRDRASLKSADSSQDLKHASEGEEGGELEEEEVTETNEGKQESDEPAALNLELTLSGCTEASVATVATLKGDFVNGMTLEETEKGIVGDQEEEDDHDPSESEEKEKKILLDTVCKTVRWLSAKLGPTVTSRYVARNLLRLLTNCYIGLENHQFVAPVSEESSLESVGMGSVYEKKPVVGDHTAGPVLECLIYIAQLYGEPVLTYQYLPYIGYLVSPPSSQRLNTRKEASLLGAVALTQKIIVFLSDTTLMDMLLKINQDVLLPLLDLLTTPCMGFPSGVQTRTAVCLKTLSLMALICLRIGREMVQQHMADTLRRFFAVFSLLHSLQPQLNSAPRRIVGEVTVVDVSTPEESNVTYELGVLEELQTVFNPEMAHASYIPFYCLIGDAAIRKLVPNHELVWQLVQSYHQSLSQSGPGTSPTAASRLETQTSTGFGRRAGCSPFPAPSSSSSSVGDSLPESGTFGSHLVGNRIQVSRDINYGGSSSVGLATSWGRSTPITTASTFTASSTGTTSFASSWVTGPTPEDSVLKQELPRSSRSLQGNWLAYWQYEIGLNQQDPHFHFHQIRLQSFLGHSSTTKCLAPLAGEDYFLSGSKDKTVKLWPLYNHGDGTQEVEPRLTYSDHRKSVFYVGQLETSQEVVSCDGTVHLWDQYTGKHIRSYEPVDGKNPITAVTTMPAPHCSVVFGSADSVLRFIDPRKPGLQHEFRLAFNNVSAGLIRYLAVSPSGRTVAAGFSSGFIVLLDARTGLILKGWPAHEGDILQMKAAEGNLVISSSTDYTLTVWKDLENKPLRQYKSQSDPVHAFDLYGSEIVTGTVANKIGVYSMADISLSPVSSTKLSSENFRGTLTSLAVLPTKRLLLLGSENGAIRLLA